MGLHLNYDVPFLMIKGILLMLLIYSPVTVRLNPEEG